MSHILLKQVQDTLITASAENYIKLFSNINDNGKLYYKDDSGITSINGNYTIETTRENIISLRDSSSLIIRQQYKIQDLYSENLILTAISVNSFSPFCYSQDYPQDIIFYDIDNNIINRRIDTVQNNDIGCDFRNIQNRRWCLSVSDAWESGYYASYSIVKSSNNSIYISLNDITLSTDLEDGNWYKYPYNSGDYIGLTSTGHPIFFKGRTCSIPVSASHSDYYMFSHYSNVKNNIIGSCSNNVIFGSFSSNNIGVDFYSNNINNNFTNNNIGHGVHSNTIGYSFSSNRIGNYSSFNIIGNDFYSNEINNNVNYNTIGNSCKYNRIYDNISYTTIGATLSDPSSNYKCDIENMKNGSGVLPMLRYYDAGSSLPILVGVS